MLYDGIMANDDAPATKADLNQLEVKIGVDLNRLEEKMGANLNRLEKQMGADLNQLEEKMGANLNQLGAQLRSEFQHGFDHLAESIHDSETRLLKAFYTFAESNQQRLSQVEGNTTAVIARLATLESRIIEVEKRLNMPPAA